MERSPILRGGIALWALSVSAFSQHVSPDQLLADTPLPNYVIDWPESLSSNVTRKKPLTFAKWDKPYANPAGKVMIDQINQWFEEGTAAGLTQDTFRSFDSNHSKIGRTYPQLTFASHKPDYHPLAERVFSDRVTFGVQSLGFHKSPFGEPVAINEFHYRTTILAALNPTLLKSKFGSNRSAVDFLPFRVMYENNTLLVAPSVWTYHPEGQGIADGFSFLSPFLIQTIGNSGSDAFLMKPVIMASAALPPKIKTRLLRTGTYTPNLLRLFKKHIGGSLRNEAAHRAAFQLPQREANEQVKLEEASFLNSLIQDAHSLTHLPPVAKLSIHSKPKWTTKVPDTPVYFGDHRYLMAATLQEGQTLELRVSLAESWKDEGQTLKAFHAEVLREPHGAQTYEAELKQLLIKYTEKHPLVQQLREKMNDASKGSRLIRKNPEGSVWEIRIPWQQTSASPTAVRRTDILFLVNDGKYDSAPAYLSVRHMQRSDKWLTR